MAPSDKPTREEHRGGSVIRATVRLHGLKTPLVAKGSSRDERESSLTFFDPRACDWGAFAMVDPVAQVRWQSPPVLSRPKKASETVF